MSESTQEPQEVGLADAPKDVPAKSRTGYAVYNRTLGQFATGPLPNKPSEDDAKGAVPEGHVTAVVAV